jgi:hypothetical protein
MTTLSGIPTRLAPMPDGVAIMGNEIPALAGVDARTLRAHLSDPSCPQLPPGTRCFGQVVRDASLVHIWLDQYRAWFKGLPALEEHRENERAKLRFEARQRELHAQDQQTAWVGERAEMIAQLAAERAEREKAEAQAQASRKAFTLGGPL